MAESSNDSEFEGITSGVEVTEVDVFAASARVMVDALMGQGFSKTEAVQFAAVFAATAAVGGERT